MNAEAPPAKQPGSLARSALVFAGKLALAAILLWWLWHSGRLNLSRLATVRPNAVSAAMVLFQAAMLLSIAARWHFLTQACGLNLRWRDTLRISLIGHFAAVWTPAGLGLDGVRFWQTRRLAPGQLNAVTTSTVWDRLLGLWALCALCAIAGLTAGFLSPAVQDSAVRHFMGLLGVVCSCAALAPAFLFKWLQQKMSERWGVTGIVSSKKKFAYNATVLAVVTHLCNFASLFLALQILNGVRPSMAAFLVLPVAVLSSLIPLTPLGLGVTDATASTLLHAVTIPGGADATMLARVTFVLLSALCGLAWLWPAPPARTTTCDNDEKST